MTSFNAPAILLGLDEYYEHYVNPKPEIPERYPGYTGSKERQAAHLQSYRDEPDDSDEDDDDDEKEQQQDDEYDSFGEESNRKQVEFETKEFNKLYKDDDDPMSEEQAVEPSTSTQWRIYPNNINRPPGAAPLVPNNAHCNSKVHQQGSLFNRNKHGHFKNQKNYKTYSNNSRNNPRISVHDRLGSKWQRGQQHNRNFLNSNKMNQTLIVNKNNNNNNNINNNNPQQQQQDLMKLNTQLQYGHAQLKVTADLNPVQSSGRISNLMSSLINSANPVQSRSQAAIHETNINDNNQARRFNFNNNQYQNRFVHVARATSTNESALDNNNFLQRQPVNSGTGASGSLRLAELPNIDQNLNVTEVARNALLLLSKVFHKPLLNEDVQQQISLLQRQNKGLPEEPTGVNMNIYPQVTDMKQNDRIFKNGI